MAVKALPRTLTLAGLFMLCLSGAQAQDGDVEAFYRGKTITFLIGTAPGAGYDIVGRAIAAHLSRFIPGQPAIIVQNMPGAGSLTMMNTLYNRAPRDGTTFGLPLNGVLLENQLQIYARGGGTVSFDVARMGWIGSPIQEPQVMWSWHSAPVRRFEDLRGAQPWTFGATSPTADNFLTPMLAKRLLGANLKLISGYQAVSNIFVAAERGEIVGNSTPLASLTLGKREELARGDIRPLAQFSARRMGQLPDVPTGIELAATEEAKRLLELWAVKFKAAYPLGLPPGVPTERLEALRRAFRALMSDPEFRATAQKIQLELDPIDGADIVTLLGSLAKANETDIQRLKEALREE